MKWLILLILTVIWIAEKVIGIKASSKFRDDLIKRFPGARLHIYGGSYLGISDTRKKILIGNGKRERIFDFDKIANVRLVIDGATVETIDKGAALLGAVAGGMTFGHAGAVIGGLATGLRTTETIDKISIEITIDQPGPPYEVLFYMSSKNGGDAFGGGGAGMALQKARNWCGHLVRAMTSGADAEAQS